MALLCGLATIAAAAGNDDTISPVDLENAVENTETMENGLENFYKTSKNKFLLALFNLSSYLPLNVEYAVTVGPECDVAQYNRDYYSRSGVIIAAVMLILGVVFCFFGK